MKIITIIPARLESSRFPNKLLKTLGKQSVLAHTYQNAVASELFSEVIVATDSHLIQTEIEKLGGKVIITKQHETGSDRIAEAAKHTNADIIINIQGDEPFLKKKPLQDLIAAFKNDSKNEISVASLYIQLKDKKDIENPNNVKVICDKNSNAMYFSRLPIPFNRDRDTTAVYKKHIGVYAFRKEALEKFSSLPIGVLENIEKIEAIRFLENQMKIKMIETTFIGVGIDTPEDLEKAKNILENYQLE